MYNAHKPSAKLTSMTNYSELTVQVQLEPDEARRRISAVMETAGGDRRQAAAALGVSYRTLQRAMLELGMAQDNKNGSTEQLLTLLQFWGGRMDYGRASMELYGEDSRAGRQRIHTRMNKLAAAGKVRRIAEGVWAVAGD